LKIFNPRSIFRDTEEAQDIASFLDEYFNDGDLEDYNFDVSFAIQYFKDRANYTDEGFEILKSCGEDLAIEQIMETFVMLYPNTKILGRYNSCLLSFGYQGRFEQERELNNWVEIEDCSVCVFDQRLCKLGNLVRKYGKERQNPYLESENGKIVNPETNDIIWYHGSWFGKLDRLKAYNPRQYYDATYFSSSEKLANEFATGEMAWLAYDEEAPRMKRNGYLHFVKIDDVKLLDSDKVFSDKEELLLTDEGIILVQALSDLGVEEEAIEHWLLKFRKGRFHD
jgi:hypothetical protein